MKNNLTKKAQSFGQFLNKNAGRIALVMLICMAMSATVFATAGADALWTTIAGTIEKWVLRLGGVVFFVGGILFGLGWKDNDASQKTTGINTMIAGGIVMAVAGLASTFFA